MFSATANASPQQSCWDRRLTFPHKTGFNTWAYGRLCIVWTAMPPLTQLRWVKELQRKTVVLPLWGELQPCDLQVLQTCDVVLCGSSALRQYLVTGGADNTRLLLWDNGQPFFTKQPPPRARRPLSIILPLWGNYARRTELTAIRLLQRLLLRFPNALATVVVSSGTLGLPAHISLERLRKKSAGRLRVRRAVPPSERHRLLASHDIALCPYHSDNLNTVISGAITAGTPVACFRLAANTDFVSEDTAVFVDCEAQLPEVQSPVAAEAYEQLDELLYYALRDEDWLREKQRTVTYGREQRRAAFARTVRELCD